MYTEWSGLAFVSTFCNSGGEIKRSKKLLSFVGSQTYDDDLVTLITKKRNLCGIDKRGPEDWETNDDTCSDIRENNDS